MSTEGRQGEGFSYEDSIRTSSLIHSLSNERFLNIDIKEITLGGYQKGYLTDDLVILDKNSNFHLMQIKKSVQGFSSIPFINFFKHALTDYKKDNNLNFYLISENVTNSFYQDIKKVLNFVKGNSYTDYVLMKRTGNIEKNIISNISKIFKITNDNDELKYNFLINLSFKEIKLYENTNYTFEDIHLVKRTMDFDNYDIVLNRLYMKILELKKINKTLNENDLLNLKSLIYIQRQNKQKEKFDNIFIDFRNYLSKELINLSDLGYNDTLNSIQKILIESESFIEKSKNIDKHSLNYDSLQIIKLIQESSKLFNVFIKDLKILGSFCHETNDIESHLYHIHINLKDIWSTFYQNNVSLKVSGFYNKNSKLNFIEIIKFINLSLKYFITDKRSVFISILSNYNQKDIYNKNKDDDSNYLILVEFLKNESQNITCFESFTYNVLKIFNIYSEYDIEKIKDIIIKHSKVLYSIYDNPLSEDVYFKYSQYLDYCEIFELDFTIIKENFKKFNDSNYEYKNKLNRNYLLELLI